VALLDRLSLLDQEGRRSHLMAWVPRLAVFQVVSCYISIVPVVTGCLCFVLSHRAEQLEIEEPLSLFGCSMLCVLYIIRYPVYL
jgi:hypothetical protein